LLMNGFLELANFPSYHGLINDVFILTGIGVEPT